jgi:energy-coupling factor transport system ATP-binding protein
VLLVVGPSGSGKSTLVRALAGLVPADIPGELSGRLTVGGLDAARAPRREIVSNVGVVFQDPAAGLVLECVEDDVAFGLENLGWPLADMRERVPAAIAAVGLAGFERRRTARLSGGEQQRVALAGALAPDPGLLVLDEPTANLDAAGTAAVFDGLAGLRAARRTTIVLVEHRVERAWPLADFVLALGPDGTPIDVGPADAVLARSGERLAAAGIWLPGDRVARPARGRLTAAHGPATLVLRDVHATPDGRHGVEPVLHGLDLEVAAGERVVVVGPNGSGKSTLCRVAAGLVRPTGGSVRVVHHDPGRLPAAALARLVGFAPQDPELGFLGQTVSEEIALGPRPVGRGGRPPGDPLELLERLGLPPAEFGGRSPYRLSGGEQRRLSLATAFLRRPDLLVLDEPTFGQDRRGHEAVVDLLAGWTAEGTAVLAASHDERFVADAADRRLELIDGWLEQPPAEAVA